jgi:long-subunit fatty acid transport protein
MSQGIRWWAPTLLLLASGARGNGAFETYGADVRTRAMANAAAASEGAAAAHTNPAAVARGPSALVFQAGFALDAPAVGVDFDDQKEPGHPLTLATPPSVAGLHFGFGMPIELSAGGPLQDRLFVGGAFYFPTEVLVRARAYDPQKPFFYAYDSYTEHYDASLAAAVRLLDWLQLGAGVRIAAGQSGDVQLAVDPVRSRLTNQSIDTFQFPTASLTAGILVGRLGLPDVVEGSIGIVYRDKSSFDIALPAALRIEGADVSAILDVLVLSNFSPRSLTSGVRLDVLRDLVVNLDAQVAFWSEAPPPFLITTVDLGGEGLEALGLEDGLDAPGPGQERVVSPGFVDTLSWRLGAEWQTFRRILALRAGYQYRPTPVPDQASGTNIVDCNTHILAGGFGLTFELPWLFARPVTIDAAYQAHVLEPRTATKIDRRDDVGDWTASGIVHSLAVGWTYAF